MDKSNLNQKITSLDGNGTARRRFFKQAAAGAIALVVARKFVNTALAEEGRRSSGGGSPKMVSPGQGMAAGLKYTDDPKTVEKALQVERGGVAFAKQKCETCSFYTPDKDSKNKYGSCVLFQATNEMVKSGSWCASWTKGKKV